MVDFHVGDEVRCSIDFFLALIDIEIKSGLVCLFFFFFSDW